MVDVERTKPIQEIGKDLWIYIVILLSGIWWVYVGSRQLNWGSIIGYGFLSYGVFNILRYIVLDKHLGLYPIKFDEPDEPCEDELCEEYHCTKCDRHFTGTNPQMKDDEMECLHCFELEADYSH